MKKKFRITLIILGIMLFVGGIIGVSYAYWQITNNQTGTNDVATGCFDLSFEETSADLILENAFPIVDSEGLSQVPYKFKVKNNCSINAKYYVTLNSFGNQANLLKESSIRYAFDLSEKTNYKTALLSEASENKNTKDIDLDDLIKSYYLKGGYLVAGQEKEFSLYLWMAIMEEMQKEFKAKIYITSVATDEAPIIASLIRPL